METQLDTLHMYRIGFSLYVLFRNSKLDSMSRFVKLFLK